MPYKAIVLCAGHGGTDQGAAASGRVEGREAVKVRDAVAALLRQRRLSVITDGGPGVNEPLTEAIRLARKTNGPRVDIHFNAGPAAATGVECLAKENQRELAQALAQAAASALNLKLRGDAGYKSASSGQHSRLAFCEAGGVVLEICFITNPADVVALDRNRQALALALAEALQNAARE